MGRLVPVKYSPYERRDQECASLGSGDGLRKGEHEGQVAIDAVLSLQLMGGFDALPGRCQLDENPLLLDAN